MTKLNTSTPEFATHPGKAVAELIIGQIVNLDRELIFMKILLAKLSKGKILSAL